MTVPRCKHFDICGSAAYQRVGDDDFCALHVPPKAQKANASLRPAFEQYVQRGGCDFRWMYLPATAGVSFERQTFAQHVDFTGASIQSVGLANSRLLGGLTVDTDANTVDLFQAVVEGPVLVKTPRPISVRLARGEFGERVEVQAGGMLSLDISYATIAGFASFVAPRMEGLNAAAVVCKAGLKLEGLIAGWSLADITVHRLFDLRSCIFAGGIVSLDSLTGDADLDLRGAAFSAAFSLRTSAIRRLYIARTRFGGECDVRAPLGGRPIAVIAEDTRPTFLSETRLTNVDLAACLIVGNPIGRLHLSDAIWPTWQRRRVLYDEIKLRRHADAAPLRSVEEAYQALKKMYQDKGDHSHAGDFHYGEMEMRRHDRSNWRSLACWEFPYWFLSGYGTRPAWSLAWLCFLTFVSACFYYWLGDHSFGEALRFSVAVATLQKRDDPSGGWVKVLQMIASAVVLALFILAVRMRVKR